MAAAGGMTRRPFVPVIGHGPIGQQVTGRLVADGHPVRVIQRHAPPELPDGAVFARADATDAGALFDAIDGCETAVLAIGLPYAGKVWRDGWPRAMAATLDACDRAGARLVFADNLYLYGPQDRPLTEDMPAADYGVKPAVRSAITRLWQRAQDAGRVRTAAVRAPDFFGPGVAKSILGTPLMGRLAAGKPAQVLISADQPHDVVHVADVARAIVSLLEAPDDAYGQAWHVPTPPTRTLREIAAIAAGALGVPARVQVLPRWLARGLGLAMPQLRETVEMHFLFDRPYVVDAGRFAARFWSDVAPLEVSIAETARSFRDAAG